jgi:hypothetical protein
VGTNWRTRLRSLGGCCRSWERDEAKRLCFWVLTGGARYR